MNQPQNTNHHKQQHGKGLKIDGDFNPKVKIILGDEEKEVSPYKVVATWIKPVDPNKPTYAFTYGMIVTTLVKNGIKPQSSLEAIKIKVNSIYKKCSELIVYDNTPGNPYPILAWWQNGQWLPVSHPKAKNLK